MPSLQDKRDSRQPPVFSLEGLLQQQQDLLIQRFRQVGLNEPTCLNEASAQVGLNEAPAPQYDLMADLLHDDMFKVLSDMLRSGTLWIQQGKSAKFGYLLMMAVATLGALNAESFCERVLSCVNLVVSDLHVRLKAEEIRMLVMLRMNREFMKYMRASYPDTPLSEFKQV